MSRVGTYLQTMAPYQFTQTPIDILDSLKFQWSTRESGSIMPPGPGVDAFMLDYEMNIDAQNNPVLFYSINVRWEPFIKDYLLKHIEPWQVWHRSRLAAISANALKINEINYRIKQTFDMQKYFKQVALSSAQLDELLSIVVLTTIKYLKFNKQWIATYIKEHKNSSLGGGFKWNNAFTVTDSEWLAILEIIKSNLENMLSHAGQYSPREPYTGIRARADQIDAVSDEYLDYQMTRSRIVMFGPWMSLVTVFIPQKAAWYEEILTKVIDYLDPEGEYFFPYILGGKIYLKASELFNAGLQYTAYDGKSWESSVGQLLGAPFRSMMVHVGGWDFLPSGSTFTSLLGTIGTIIATMRTSGTWLVLGDDANHFGNGKLNFPPMEYQPEDTKFWYLLGVCFKPDINQPRITGIKLTMDRAREMKPLTMHYFQHNTVLVSRKRADSTRVAWAGLFNGWFGEGTLLQAIQKIKPGEYKSPSEEIESLVESSFTDPYAWAEREGVKKVFA
jgi:hypothetical protein